jgi:hypothetical protein
MSFWLLGLLLYPEDGESTSLINVDGLVLNYIASHYKNSNLHVTAVKTSNVMHQVSLRICQLIRELSCCGWQTHVSGLDAFQREAG